MKGIKFSIMAILVGLFALGIASAQSGPSLDLDLPAFDKPFTQVIDVWTYGKRYEDYIRFISSIAARDISFMVYGYDTRTKTWSIIGTAHLKNAGDTDRVNSQFNGKLNKFRYIAIQSMDEINFYPEVVVARNDIRITVYDRDDLIK